MAVRIRRYRPPEFTVTLTAGGSLAANTTYYFTGYFSVNWTYNDAGSIFGDVKSFTTTDTNKSISVYWKVTVPIQSFADAGSGKIQVNATNHCVDAGDTVIIESGAYAGTYTVTDWINYNSFKITGVYSTTYSTTFRVESLYNTNSLGSNSIIMYMSPTAPFSGDPTAGTWSGDFYGCSNYCWQKTYTGNNFTLSAPFAFPMYGAHPQIMSPMMFTIPSWCKVQSKGKMWIDIIGNATVSELKQACIDADVLDVCYVESDTFVAWAIVCAYIGNITFTDMSITICNGFISGLVTYTRCSCNFLMHGYGSYWEGTANNTNFLFKADGFPWANAPYNYPIGSNNSFISSVGLSAEGIPPCVISNMTLNATDGQWNICGYTTGMKYLNCRSNGAFLWMYYHFLIGSPNPDAERILDNFYIDSVRAYDICTYSSLLSMRVRNVDTPRTNNRKVVYHQYNEAATQSVYFYRGGTLTVLDSGGAPVIGASVNLTDDHNIQYDYTTDSNGQVDFEVLEQLSVNPAGIGYATDTYYDNWILTINKSGYQLYQSTADIAKNIEDSVTLTASTTPSSGTSISNSTIYNSTLY